LLGAVTISCALVSSAFGQVQLAGEVDKQTSPLAEPAAREASAPAATENAALAEWIVAREEARSGRQFDTAFRARTVQSLASLSYSVLAELQTQEGFGTNSLGDSQADLVYTPVTPCRIIDTRLAGGALSPGVPRSFKVTGNTTSQGGANCGIPFGPATSAMINFVAVSPAGKGNMQITPYGSAMPLASFINYSNTAGTALANGLAVALCDPSAATCTFDVTAQSNVSAVDLVADVQGYYERTPNSTGGSAFSAVGLVAGQNYYYPAATYVPAHNEKCLVSTMVALYLQTTAFNSGYASVGSALRDVTGSTDSGAGYGAFLPFGGVGGHISGGAPGIWTLTAGRTYKFGCFVVDSGNLADAGHIVYCDAFYHCQ
jgi:hypothetical protein